jgi:hypothetical protein
MDAFGMGNLVGPRVFSNPLAMLGDMTFGTPSNTTNADLIFTQPLALGSTQTASGPGTVRTLTTNGTGAFVVFAGGGTTGRR